MGPRVVVAGYLVRYPIGGYAWQALHFLAGFRALGCDVFFYEDNDYYAEAYVPGGAMQGESYDYGVAFAARLFGEHGLRDAWAFWDARRNTFHGADEERTRAALADADVFVNLGGVNSVPRARRPRALGVYVDLDPSYTQIRLTDDAPLRAFLAEHDVHFTLGENIGRRACRIPHGGFDWRPIRQPVVLDFWTPLPPAADAPFSTIGTWDSGGRDVTFDGQVFGWRKRPEWLRLIELPRITGQRFCVALDLWRAPDDLRMLESAGWEVVDPLEISRAPGVYRDFIRRSRGEFTVAKDVNIRLASGWFSDRSACYLAAGRPVVNQDTGFDRVLPTGTGLFSFRTLDDVVTAIAAITADYDKHSRAARAIAAEFFDPARVLGPVVALAR